MYIKVKQKLTKLVLNQGTVGPSADFQDDFIVYMGYVKIIKLNIKMPTSRNHN